jgi:hypothetical protein
MRLHATRRAAIAQARGLGNPLWDLAGVPPSLDLRFAESKSLIDAISGQELIAFSRQSDRSVITSAGGMDVIGTGAAGFTHDPFTLESLGLFLEELRPNLLLNSAAPANQNITVAATPYTLSFYGSGDIVLTGAHSATVIGTGAFPNRRVLTFTPTAGTLGVTVSGTVEFANLEPGTFATSWIPTGVSQATRSADLASITGANFSSWYRQDEGTVFAGFIPQAAPFSTGRPVWGLSDGISSRIDFRCRPTSKGGLLVLNAGASQADTSGTNNYTTGKNTSAIAYAENNFASCLNSESPATDSLGTVPASINQLLISTAGNISGAISRLTYWPQRLPNSTLQNITL